MARGTVWVRDELLVAFGLYCRIPFGKLHHGNPDVIKLAECLGRSSNSVAMKLVNFASFDPDHLERGVKGLSNASKGDRDIWDEFHNDWEGLAFESELALGRLLETESDKELVEEVEVGESAATEAVGMVGQAPPYSTEAVRSVRVRLVQRFFREAVLSSYGYCCSVCQLGLVEMLNASHIVPWSKDEKRRADPCNGLSLCVLHDRAFDRGFITVDEDYRVVVAGAAKVEDAPELHDVGLLKIEGRRIELPERFRPDAGALGYHREVVFRG